jgi:serine/threonine protein kinase
MSQYLNNLKDFASSVAREVSSASGVGGGGEAVPEYINVSGKQYQILEKHGEGGFSFVYKVVDSRGEVYALKRILLVDKKAAENAKREVDFLKTLPRHRAIVELVAADISSQEALILFEFCGGGSVYHLIERRLEQGRPLGENEVWAIFHATCEAVEHMHSQTPVILHRDLVGISLLLLLLC